MHEIAFADAVRPAQSVILKLIMRQYSIGHEVLLLNQRNPLAMMTPEEFLKLPIENQCAAVISAALTCYRGWVDNHKPEKHLWFWRWMNRNTDYPFAIAQFRTYRAAGSMMPPVVQLDGKNAGRSLGAPFHAALIQFLMKMGKTETEAYDYPLGLAQFHYYTNAEREGGLKIVNAAETEFEEYCRREDEKAAKAKEATCPV